MEFESIEQAVHELGNGMEQEAVITGSTAAQQALPDFRDPNDLDIVLSPAAFHYLQGQPQWEQTPDGRLLHGGMDVGAGWGENMSFEELRARSWKTGADIQVAGLPDVYAYKERRGTPSDVEDNAYIRDQLQSPDFLPLKAEVIPDAVAAVRDSLPETLRDKPEAEPAILLAANGLHTVQTVYGHPDIGQANQITGDLERADFLVPATYHNGFGLTDDARALQSHLTNIGASDHEHLLALAADPFTDAIYGNGRFANNPEGYDEQRSADLLRARALQLGFSEADANRMHAAALMTAFDEQTRTQRGTKADDLLARAVVGVDLQTLSEPDSVERAIDLAVEDGCSARYSPDRILGKVLAEHGVRVYSTAQALELIDQYANHKPGEMPDGPTVMQFFAKRLLGNAVFHRSYVYPADWTLDNPAMRERHARQLEVLAARLLAGEITAVQAGQLAAEHTHACRP